MYTTVHYESIDRDVKDVVVSKHLKKLISKKFKLAKINNVLVLGSVEDECCFFILKFLKSCYRNKLENYFLLVVRMFGL